VTIATIAMEAEGGDSMKRGTKDVVAALAVGGGILAIITAVELKLGRTTAPVLTRGRGARGRWAAPSYLGAEIAEYPPMLVELIRQVLSEYEAKAAAERAARAEVQRP